MIWARKIVGRSRLLAASNASHTTAATSNQAVAECRRTTVVMLKP